MPKGQLAPYKIKIHMYTRTHTLCSVYSTYYQISEYCYRYITAHISFWYSCNNHAADIVRDVINKFNEYMHLIYFIWMDRFMYTIIYCVSVWVMEMKWSLRTQAIRQLGDDVYISITSQMMHIGTYYVADLYINYGDLVDIAMFTHRYITTGARTDFDWYLIRVHTCNERNKNK